MSERVIPLVDQRTAALAARIPAMPVAPTGLLTDARGRPLRDLRISVTDRCNLRCGYCMAGEVSFSPRRDVLTIEELEFLTSAFIGFLMYLGLVVLHVQYAPLIGLIVGVTNVIPYFGPIVGSVPGILLTLMYNPMLALEVAIWNLIVQQFDGNVLGPNVLGHIVELNPFWVLVSVMIGGSILGPFGMFVAIPVGAVIRVFINEWMRRKEEKQKTKALPLPTDPRDGAEVDE